MFVTRHESPLRAVELALWPDPLFTTVLAFVYPVLCGTIGAGGYRLWRALRPT